MMFTAMAAVVLTWVVISAAHLGLGALLLRAAGHRITTVDRALVTLVLGQAACLAVLQIWHFWSAITVIAGVVLLLGGALGLVMARADVRTLAARMCAHPGAIAAGVVALVWLANHALAAGDAVDSGAYQYASVRWMTAYPVVPGLANLDAALGVTNASLLLHAALDAAGSPWQGRAEHVGNGVFLLPLVALALISIWRVQRAWRRRALDAMPAAEAFGAALVVPALLLSLGRELTSPRTDLPTMLYAACAVWRLLALLASTRETDRRVEWLAVAVYAATLPTLKLSLAPLGFTAWLVAAVSAWWMTTPRRRVVTPLAFAVACSCVIVVPSLVRAYYVSGYPLFPATVAAASVDWKVRDDARRLVEAEVREWPRVTQPQLAADTLHRRAPDWILRLLKPPDSQTGGSWVVPWLLSSLVLWPIEVAGALLMMGLALWPRRASTGAHTRTLWLAVVPPLIGMIFWFTVAPLPRYGYAALWTAAAALCAVRWKVMMAGRGRVVAATLLAALLAATVGHRLLANVYLYRTTAWHGVVWVPAGSDAGFHPRPATVVTPLTTRSGLTVWIPKDQSLLWNAPLLSSFRHQGVEGLQLRDPRDIAQGFRSEPR